MGRGRTSSISLLFIFFALSIVSAPVQAQTLPQNLTIEGRLFSSGSPVNASVNIMLEVVDSGNSSCVLFRETHTGVDVSSTDADLQGRFSLKLGGGTSNFLATGASSLQDVFSRKSMSSDADSNNTLDGADAACANLTPAAASERLVKVYVNGSHLTPDITVTSVPGALVAETLQGKAAGEFISVVGTSNISLTQSNVEKLLELVNNTFTGAYSFNGQRLTGVAAPTASTDAATKGYADATLGSYTLDVAGVGPATGNGKTLIWDQGQNKWVTGTPTATDSTKLPLAGGTMTGTISMGGFDIRGAGNISLAGGKVLQLGTLNNAAETGLGLGAGDAGKIFFNTDSSTLRVWNGTAYQPFYTLSTTGVTAGSYGSASSVAQFTVDAQGRISSATDVAISIPTTALQQGSASSGQVLMWNGSAWLPSWEFGDITRVDVGVGLSGGGTTANVSIDLANTAVTPGTYGSASQIPTFTVDQQGRLTFADALPVAINPTAINQYSAASGQVLKWNGSAWLPANDIDTDTGITALTGDVSASGNGSVVATIGNDKINAFKVNSTGVAISRLLITDPVVPSQITYATCATDGQVLKYAAATGWYCANDNSGGASVTSIEAGSGLNGGTITSTGTISLANTSVTAGSYGSATEVAKYTVDSKGRLTYSEAIPIRIPTSALTQTGAASGQVLKWNGSAWLFADDVGMGAAVSSLEAGVGLNGGTITTTGTISLANTSVTSGSYGSASQVATFSVDAQGRLTFANNTPVAINTTALNQTGAASGQVLKWNGSAWLAADESNASADISSVVAGTGLNGGGVTGDVTLTLANTAVTSGSYGSASQVATYTVDPQGRLTASASTPIAINPTQINSYAAASGQILKWNGSAWLPADDIGGAGYVTNIATGTGISGGPITSTGTISLANTSVTAGNYGSTSLIPAFTVDAQGRLTLAQEKAVIIDTTALNQTGAAAGQVLKWNGSAWLAANDSNAGGDITDVVAGSGLTGGGSIYAATLSLANTSVTSGSYGSASSVATYTVDGQGRLTASNSTPIAINPTQINQYGAAAGQILKWNGSAWLAADDTNAGGDITSVVAGSGLTGGGTSAAATVSLANTAVTAGSYGTASSVANFTVDAQGRLTFASNTPIAINTTAINQTGAAAGQVLKWNGSAWLAADDTNAGGDITSVVAGSGLTGGGTSAAATVSLANTAVTTGTYGSASQVAKYTVDAQGRLTYAEAVPISISTLALTQTSAIAGQVLKWNGTAWFAANDSGTGTVTMVAAGTGLVAGTISTSGTLNVDVGATAWKIPQYDGSGNLGVGTTAASYPLHLIKTQNAATYAVIQNNSAGAAATAGLFLQNDATNQFGIGLNGSGLDGNSTIARSVNDLVIYRQSTQEQMRFKANGAIGIGTNTPAAGLDVFATGGQSALVVPRDTAANRPTSAVNGMIRYNTTLAAFEVYQAANWATISTGSSGVSFPLLANPTGTVGAPAYSFNADANTGIYSTTEGEISLAINGTERARFDSNGLFMNANFIKDLNAGMSSAPSLSFNGDPDSGIYGPSPGLLAFVTNSTERLRIGINGQVMVSLLGTASAPAYTFTSDTNTGIYNVGSGRLAFSTEGTERLRIAQDGTVAIGTTSPTADSLLHVHGINPATSNIHITNATTGSTLSDGFYLGVDPSSGVSFWQNETSPISFYTLGTERLRLESTGRLVLGNGTGTAGSALDIQGTGVNFSSLVVPRDTSANRPTSAVNGMIRYNTNLSAFEVYQNANWATVATGNGSGDNLGNHTATQNMRLNGFYLSNDGGNEGVYVDPNGRVGIATNTALTEALEVNGNAYVSLDLNLGGSVMPAGGIAGSPGLNFGGSNSGVFYNGTDLGLSTAGTERLRVTSLGRVGIGTTAPAAGSILDVRGTGSQFSAMIVPRDGGGANRPGGVNGMIRYNTSSSKFEVYEAGTWINMIGGAASSSLSSITGATSTNSIENLNYTQTWSFSTLGPTTGLNIVSTGLTTGTVLQVTNGSLSGAGTSARFFVTGTGSSGTAIRGTVSSTVSSGTALWLDNSGTGNTMVVEDVSSDPTPFVIDNAGNMSVGGTVYAQGQMNSVSKWNSSANAASIDFDTGNVQGIEFPPNGPSQNISLTNMKDGGSYVVILKSTVASQQFNFPGPPAQCSSPANQHWNPANGPTSVTPGGYYIYNILYIGPPTSKCFITWSGPF